MRKIISSTLLCAMLTVNPMNVAFAKEVVQTSKPVVLKTIFDQFKTDVFINGKKMDEATKELVAKIVDAKISTGELQNYVAATASKKDQAKFNEMLTLAVGDMENLNELSSEDLSFVLKNTMEMTNTTGSNFMSCTAGLGIGVPLIAVGVILGITALVNATASKELITQDYLAKKQQLATDYYNTLADLELEKATYEADIIYYQDEIDELNRRIDSGNYSNSEIEQMHQLIRDYTFKVTDAQALIEEVLVDYNYFINQYASDSAIMSGEEQSALARIDERNANAGKQAIAAGIIGGVGVLFTSFGANDCN